MTEPGAQGAAIELIAACRSGSSVELQAALDRVDTREAAAGLAWLLSHVIGRSGQDPAEFFADLRAAILAEHLRRPVSLEG